MPVVTRAAATSRVFGVPVPERTKALRVAAGSAPVVSWTMADTAGTPIDLSAYVPAPPAVPDARLTLLEAVVGGPAPSFAATIADPAAGLLEATLDLTRVPAPGIYHAEFAVLDPGTGAVAYSNRSYLVVEASLFAGRCAPGPPTLPEVRLAIRSSGPAENRLLDDVAFDDAEVAQALVMCVAYFNESQPRVRNQFSTADFPSRYHWCRGAAAQLFWMVAEYYRQNQLAYGAGGVSVDDFNKAPLYDAVADKYWAEYVAWARGTKATMAQDEAWGSSDSPYSYSYGFGGWTSY